MPGLLCLNKGSDPALGDDGAALLVQARGQGYEGRSWNVRGGESACLVVRGRRRDLAVIAMMLPWDM